MGLENVPETMLAAQVVEYKKPYSLNQVKVPRELKGRDILVKTAVASLCHTDNMVAEGIFKTKLPCTGSHEGTGTIVACGPEAGKFGFKEGDRVMCGLYRNWCHICKDCQGPENFRQYCEHSDGIIGVTVNGAFAEYVLCDAETSAKLPDEVSFETAAPLACAGCTIWRGILQSKTKAGEWLAIVGSGGGLGHLGVQFAKAIGIKVIGIDARDEGLALTKEYGADVVVDARKGKEAVVEEVKKVTGGEGADATVNVSDANSAAAMACAITKTHGKMIQIAQPENVSIPFAEFIFRDIRVEGSLICSPDEMRQMLDVVAKHKITVKSNPVNGLKEIPKLVEFAHSGKMQGKAICIIDQEQIESERKAGVKLT